MGITPLKRRVTQQSSPMAHCDWGSVPTSPGLAENLVSLAAISVASVLGKVSEKHLLP